MPSGKYQVSSERLQHNSLCLCVYRNEFLSRRTYRTSSSLCAGRQTIKLKHAKNITDEKEYALIHIHISYNIPHTKRRFRN